MKGFRPGQNRNMKVIRAYKSWSNGIFSWRFVHIWGGHYQRRWRNGRSALPYLSTMTGSTVRARLYSLAGNTASDRRVKQDYCFLPSHRRRPKDRSGRGSRCKSRNFPFREVPRVTSASKQPAFVRLFLHSKVLGS